MKTMWLERHGKLYQRFEFENFSEAFAFMTKVAALAEEHNHHPTWYNMYNTVEIWLCTRDAGNAITQKDEDLAEAIDQLLAVPETV